VLASRAHARHVVAACAAVRVVVAPPSCARVRLSRRPVSLSCAPPLVSSSRVWACRVALAHVACRVVARPVVSLSRVHLSHRRRVRGLSRRVAHVAGRLVVAGAHLSRPRRATVVPAAHRLVVTRAPVVPPSCARLSCRCRAGAPVVSPSCARPVASCCVHGWAVRATLRVAVALHERGHVGGGGSARAGAWVGLWARGWGGRVAGACRGPSRYVSAGV